jgi:hypothetical protein
MSARKKPGHSKRHGTSKLSTPKLVAKPAPEAPAVRNQPPDIAATPPEVTVEDKLPAFLDAIFDDFLNASALVLVACIVMEECGDDDDDQSGAACCAKA